MMSIVNLISDRLNSSIENEGFASLVLSGGSRFLKGLKIPQEEFKRRFSRI